MDNILKVINLILVAVVIGSAFKLINQRYLARNYYMQLSQIDYNLGTMFQPVNKAMKIALEEVLHYYAYRPFPENFNK